MNKQKTKSLSKRQEQDVDEIIRKCKLEIKDYDLDFEDIAKIEHFKKVRVFIIDSALNCQICYSGNPKYETRIYLLKIRNHFDLITDPKKFYGKRNYCYDCEKPFDRSHKCEVTKKVIKQKSKSNKKYCRICQCMYDNIHDHKCVIQKKKPKTKNSDLIFADFESEITPTEHIPNYMIAEYRDSPKVYKFENGGDSVVNKACKWLFQIKHVNHTIIFHNLKGSDRIFLLNWLITNGYQIFTIYQGAKILSIHVTSKICKKLNIRVIDSLSFLTTSLAKLPKMFGFKGQKGDFPYLFNKKSNWNYVGPIPLLDQYEPEKKFKNKKDLDNFMEWYKSKGHKKYNFQKDLHKYCVGDVEILKKACIIFQDLMFQITDNDPFQFITIASFCMNVFRSKFLQHPLSITKASKNDMNTSDLCVKWLEFQSKLTGKNIEHAYNTGEHRPLKDRRYKVDGYEPKSDTIYEFHGCYYHGCPKCYDHQKDKYAKLRYEKTLEKANLMKGCCKQYVEMWECEYRKLETTPLFKEFSPNFKTKVIKKCHPIQAFFGGLVDAATKHYKCQPGEIIRYVDFTSLYPWVNKYCEYPIGEEIYCKGDQIQEEWSNYFGIVQCKVLAPPQLLFPILPVKHNHKLYTPLCYTCMKEHNPSTCTHCVEDRALIGTWSSIELKEAEAQGYKILEWYDGYKFEQTSNDLFKGYVNTFLKIKQEASGFPEWVQTEPDKHRYVLQYHEKEGILLDLQKIEYNPGLRACAKLCLNNLWGKFNQKLDYPKSKVLYSADDLYQIAFNKNYQIQEFYLINEDTAEIKYKDRKEQVKPHNFTNNYIGVFTTAHARLKLLRLLKKLGKKVLYYDTDSCVYVEDPSTPKIELGDYLGDLTDELDGDHIIEFVGLGPKSYAYKTAKKKEKLWSKIKVFESTSKTPDSLTLIHSKIYCMKTNPILWILSIRSESTKKRKRFTAYIWTKRSGSQKESEECWKISERYLLDSRIKKKNTK